MNKLLRSSTSVNSNGGALAGKAWTQNAIGNRTQAPLLAIRGSGNQTIGGWTTTITIQCHQRKQRLQHRHQQVNRQHGHFNTIGRVLLRRPNPIMPSCVLVNIELSQACIPTELVLRHITIRSRKQLFLQLKKWFSSIYHVPCY